MRRITIALLAALLVGALPSGAGAARVGETYEGEYAVPGAGGCAFGADHYTCAYAWDCRHTNSGCALVKLERPTHKARFEITDQSGGQVFARVYAPGWDKPVALICAVSGEPVNMNLKGVSELIVHIVNGTCPDSSPSTPTAGVVRVTRL